MKLWILDADASDADIEAGCRAAEALITSRGITVEAAYAAVLARAGRERFDSRAARAWDDGEDAAFRACYGERDDWPDDAVLAPADEAAKPERASVAGAAGSPGVRGPPSDRPAVSEVLTRARQLGHKRAPAGSA